MVNALSFDVEEWFQATSIERRVNRCGNHLKQSRVERQLEIVGSILEKVGVKATFFVVANIAKLCKGPLRKLADEGHEIASHSLTHKLVCHLTKEAFSEEILSSKAILEEITQYEVLGYRAPSFSVSDRTPWFFSSLRRVGYRYSSSIVPDSPRFRLKGCKPFPFERDGIIEFPVSTSSCMGRRYPFSGGFFFRVLPFSLILSGIRKGNQRGLPAMVYIHPWELDLERPRLSGKSLSHFIHYGGQKRTKPRLDTLLSEFSFAPAWEVLKKIKLKK